VPKLVKIEVHGSAASAAAAKQLMTTDLGFKPQDVQILDGQRVKVFSQGVSNTTDVTFEDPSDNQLHVVIGTR